MKYLQSVGLFSMLFHFSCPLCFFQENHKIDAQEVKKEETKRSIRWSIAAAVFGRKTGLYGGGIFSTGEKRGILNAMNRNGSKKDEDCKMNIEERAAQAAAWKAAGQCNCAQAVLKAFEDKLPVDADTLMKLGAGYAAGMGCMESTCGALIGAVMVAGVVTDGKGTPRISKELLQNFQEKCGATICKDLKGVETGAPLCPCPECVRNAVLALGEALGE